MPEKQLIVVPGFGATHLRDTAILLEENHLLSSIILPFNLALGETSLLRKIAILNRAANRNYGLPKARIQSLFIGDVIYQIGFFIHRRISQNLGIFIESLGFIYYSNSAARKIQRMKSSAPLIVRAGFGGIILRKNRNAVICDVSLVHPMHLKSLIDTGQFSNESQTKLNPVERLIARDIEESSYILVNSKFVAESLLRAGVPGKKITVAYLDPEKIFRKFADNISTSPRTKSNYVLFAGTLEKRKGIDELYELARHLKLNHPEIEMHLVGNWMPSGAEMRKKFRDQSNVKIFSWMSRENLVEKMYHSLIFIFPSRAEGSARVITESMYLGVPVVTTYNSGSPIVDSISGRLVPSNTSEVLNKAVSQMILDHAGSEKLGQMGKEQVSKMIRQQDYFVKLFGLINFHS